MTTEQTIFKIVADQVGLTPDEISRESTPMDVGADSLDLIEIIMVTEDEFEISFSDEAAEKFENLGQLIDAVLIEIGTKPTPPPSFPLFEKETN